MQYSETSTGVLHNIKALGELTKGTDILLVVDNISALVVNPFEFDGWSVDCSIAGSQKGFFMPPGLSFITLSKKAKEAMKKSDLPKFYFDLKKYYKALEGKQSEIKKIKNEIIVENAYVYLSIENKDILNEVAENIKKLKKESKLLKVSR